MGTSAVQWGFQAVIIFYSYTIHYAMRPLNPVPPFPISDAASLEIWMCSAAVIDLSISVSCEILCHYSTYLRLLTDLLTYRPYTPAQPTLWRRR